MAVFKRGISGSLSFSGSVPKLQWIRIYCEKRLWEIILLALLIMGSSCVGFFLNPWISCSVNLIASGFSVWFGYKALTRVKDIKTFEEKEVS